MTNIKYLIGLFVTIVVCVSSTAFANSDRALYDSAIKDYNEGNYSIAKSDFSLLVAKQYDKPYIYFVLGKIHRKENNRKEALSNFKKYISISLDERNRMYATINLAYLLIEEWNGTNLEIAKSYIDSFANSKYVNDVDYTYCFATVYNSYGYYFLKYASENDTELYYKHAESLLNKAVTKRPELIGNANNLAVSNIMLFELTKKVNYYDKAREVLYSDMYKNTKHELFKNTRSYFNTLDK